MISPQEYVSHLNRALELDRESLTALVNNRVRISQALLDADLPFLTTVDDEWFGKQPGWSEMGVIGLINGILGPEDPIIAAIYDEHDEHKLLRFTLINRMPAA